MSTEEVLIPKGFHRVAESEFMSGTAAVYYSKDRKLLLVVVDNKQLLGPFAPGKLECIHHVLTDVKEMKGRYGQV